MTKYEFSIVESRIFRCITVLLCVYGFALSLAGFLVGRLTETGLLDFKQRWFEIQHFVHQINPFDVMNGSVDALEGVPFMYVGGYPPWSYTVGTALIPPLNFQYSLFVFTVVQLLSLSGILILIYKTTGKYVQSKWVAFFFIALFLSLPGLATDLKWGNYTVISVFFLMLCIYLSESKRLLFLLLAGFFYSIAFVKPQLIALFGLILLFKGYWKVWSVAAALVALYTLISSVSLHVSPWLLVSQLFESTVNYTKLYNYARYYNHGLLDILKLFEVPVDMIVRVEFPLSVAAVSVLYWKYYKHVSAVTIWAIPSTFALLWSYNQKYDWLIIFFLLFAFGIYAFRSSSGLAKRNIACFAGLTVISLLATFKLMWFGYVINCWLQFLLRFVWLVGLLLLLRWQSAERKEPEVCLDSGCV